MDQVQIIDPIPMAVMFDWATSTRKPAKLKGKAMDIEDELKLSTNKTTDYQSGMSDQTLEELHEDADLIQVRFKVRSRGAGFGYIGIVKHTGKGLDKSLAGEPGTVMVGLGDGQLIVNTGNSYQDRVLTEFGCGQIADSSEIDIIADAANKTVTFSVLRGDGVKCNTEKLTHPMLQESLEDCRLAVSLAYGASIEIVDPPPAQLWRQMKGMTNKLRQARKEKKTFTTELEELRKTMETNHQKEKTSLINQTEKLKKDFEDQIQKA